MTQQTQHPELTTLKKYLTNQLTDDERYEFESHFEIEEPKQ